MLLRQVIELFDLLDTPAANGTTVTNLFKERGNVEVTVENVKGDEGDTDCVTILIKGSEGKSIGGSAPTLGIIGRLGVSAKAGGEAASLLGIVSEQAQEGWIRIPELSTRRAILNLTGIWMQDYCPANTGVEDVYYADGWYYINEVSFAETLTKGYLPKGQNGSGYSFFDSYDAPTGMMDGAVTVLLSESDNDYGIAAQVRSSEKITDGRYINVYESIEERELSESIKDIWMTESASYQFDNYSRILTVQSLVSPDAGIETHFRYSCKPGEDDGTFTMEWKGMDEANIDQVRTFTVSVDEETQAMKLTDAQTQEEITLNSIAQQANQPTMSGQ